MKAKVSWTMIMFVLQLSLLFQPPPLVQAFDLCTAKDDPSFELVLIGANLFKDYLMLTTRTFDDGHNPVYTVYKIPMANVDNSYGQLLISVEGVPLEKFWKGFELTNPTWGPVADKIIIFWLINKVKPYMYFRGLNGVPCPVYNVSAQQWMDWIKLDWPINPDGVLSLIADGYVGKHVFSAIATRDAASGQLIQNLWVWTMLYTSDGLYVRYDNTPNGSHFAYFAMLYYLKSKDDADFLNITVLSGWNKSFTSDNDPYRNVDQGQYYLTPLTDWSVDQHYQAPGYIYRGLIRIFDKKKVFIFEDHFDESFRKYLNQSGVILYSTKLKAVPVKDYFKCDKIATLSSDSSDDEEDSTKDLDPRDKAIGGGGSHLWIWIVISLVVATLLIILLGLYLCGVFDGEKKRGKNHKNSGPASKGGGGGGGKSNACNKSAAASSRHKKLQHSKQQKSARKQQHQHHTGSKMKSKSVKSKSRGGGGKSGGQGSRRATRQTSSRRGH